MQSVDSGQRGDDCDHDIVGKSRQTKRVLCCRGQSEECMVQAWVNGVQLMKEREREREAQRPQAGVLVGVAGAYSLIQRIGS